MMDIIKKISEIDTEKYILADYHIMSTKSIYNAAYQLAVGQSIGNPNVRNDWETEELIENHCAWIIESGTKDKVEARGHITIAFPLANLDLKSDGVSQLLCHLMGGQMDIDSIVRCRLTALTLPNHLAKVPNDVFRGPLHGMTGARNFTGVPKDRPLLGAIIKPKVGLNPEQLLYMVKQLVEGGVNFIKEDEIMGGPERCPIERRVPLIAKYLADKKVIYCFCINSDYPSCINRANYVAAHGVYLGVHANVWCGLGIYRTLRNHSRASFIHFQKSGDKVFTQYDHRYGIDWTVICQLAGLMGVDFIHAGMIGGYSDTSEAEMTLILDTLKQYNVVPALSCGMHPGLVDHVTEKVGPDYMANVGGAIHGHPSGTLAGAKAMRQAIDGDYGKEYYDAIDKWGKV